jgi:hypothetical protein
MAERSKPKEQPQPSDKRDQTDRAPQRPDFERRIERQTFNAGERDKADDGESPDDDSSRNGERDEGPAGENLPRRGGAG